jgi:hypothetical protein
VKYKPWPKRDLVKDYFQLPNEIFLLGLSPGALAIYAYLLCCEDRSTCQCWPSYKTIGRTVRVSASTVRKYVCAGGAAAHQYREHDSHHQSWSEAQWQPALYRQPNSVGPRSVL